MKWRYVYREQLFKLVLTFTPTRFPVCTYVLFCYPFFTFTFLCLFLINSLTRNIVNVLEFFLCAQ